MKYRIEIKRKNKTDRLYCERENIARRACVVIYKFDKSVDRVEIWEDNKIIEIWEG